ncbi:class I SAM-dependent methyltransferase [Psychroserpens sp.]
MRSFIEKNNKDLICPFCGSLARTRRLWSILKTKNSIKGNLLHFSPSRSVYRILKKATTINYYSSDFEDEFLADYNFDITQINQENETFDTIICYHILEHIVNDKAAISELFRVLKPNGVIYIQTPFKDGDIYEDYSITSPKEREKHFGQNDHVRIYSAEGLKERLEIAGFKVDITLFNDVKKDLYNGFKSPEIVLIATK